MAIKLPLRRYLTLPELVTRWECTDNDVRDLIIRGELRPSFIINYVANKVRFYTTSDDAGAYWQSETVGSLKDDDGKSRPKLYDVEGAYYLLHPDVTSGLDCHFRYFSQDKEHVKGAEDKNICFMLNGNHGLGRGVSLDTVFTNGMVMWSELTRFEEQEAETHHTEPLLKTRERHTLLTIIAVLCKEAKLDYSKAAKTAGMIQSTAASMGLSIGESTIEGHLKKITNAIAGRVK